MDDESESYSLTDPTVSGVTGGTALPGGLLGASRTGDGVNDVVITLPAPVARIVQVKNDLGF